MQSASARARRRQGRCRRSAGGRCRAPRDSRGRARGRRRARSRGSQFRRGDAGRAPRPGSTRSPPARGGGHRECFQPSSSSGTGADHCWYWTVAATNIIAAGLLSWDAALRAYSRSCCGSCTTTRTKPPTNCRACASRMRLAWGARDSAERTELRRGDAEARHHPRTRGPVAAAKGKLAKASPTAPRDGACGR